MKRTLVRLTVLITASLLIEIAAPTQTRTGSEFSPNSASHPAEETHAQTIPPPPEAFEELGYRFRQPDLGVRPLREEAPAATVTVTGIGNVAVIQDDGSLVGHQNLFDLDQSTLRFAPRPEGGYFVEKIPLVWDDDPGTAISYVPQFSIGSREVQFDSISFPFGGMSWNALFINSTGSITFGYNESQEGRPEVPIFDDFAEILSASGTLMIAPLWHRFSPFDPSQTFFKEMQDRVVVTWDVTEEFNFDSAFSRSANENRLQAVLLSSGEILLSYNGISTLDGVTGVFPGITPINPPLILSTNQDPQDLETPAHLDILNARVEQVDALNLRFTYDLRGVVPAPHEGLTYRFFIDIDPPFLAGGTNFNAADCDVTVFGSPSGWKANHCLGETLLVVQNNQVSGLLPLNTIGFPQQFKWFGDAVDFSSSAECCNFDVIPTVVASPTDFGGDREISFTASLPRIVRSGAIFESFHYPVLLASSESLASLFYQTFPDSFDFLVLLTSMRFDQQLAGASAFGARNNSISGIGLEFDETAGFGGSAGRLQYGQNPSWLNGPFLYDQAGEDAIGSFDNYDRAMSFISHELGHRWGPKLDFLDDSGVRSPLHDNAPHWLTNVHMPSAVTLKEIYEGSPMGGAFWVENNDGTFTDYIIFPRPTGYGFLDLYAMGLMPPEEVPNFFLLENISQPTFVNGQRVVSAEKKVISIDQVIAAMGPRLPPASDSQKSFSTAFILVVPNGTQPAGEDLNKVEEIRLQWEEFFRRATAGRATMSTTLVTAPPPTPQVTSAGVVHAASFRTGPVAPGLIVSIFGSGIGPFTADGGRLDFSGGVDSFVRDTKVLFDGIPAPLVYVQGGQVNAIVPYSVAGRTTTQLEIEYLGVKSNPVALSVADTVPGIFTVAGGIGQAAMLNENGSFNSPSNPATKGSIVTMFATGEGQTDPPGIDGMLSADPLPKPQLPVSLRIGGLTAEVLYAGAAPGFAGLLQVNARVPNDVAAMDDVEVLLTIGSSTSQSGVTMAVR